MADRPLECNQCKKNIKVVYKEIAHDSIVSTEMCADCPVLQERLHGEPLKDQMKGREGELCCGFCGTSLASIKTGQPLGCSECYAVFGDFLISELQDSDALPTTLRKKEGLKRVQNLHAGRSPHKITNISLSTQITSLNEALNEALKRENYEQAAWLRDQIKALTEKEHG